MSARTASYICAAFMLLEDIVMAIFVERKNGSFVEIDRKDLKAVQGTGKYIFTGTREAVFDKQMTKDDKRLLKEIGVEV